MKYFDKINSIVMLAYPNCGEQDTLVPVEMLKSLAWRLGEKGRRLEVRFLGLQPGNVTMQMGTSVATEGVLGSAELADMLYVPGGMGSGKASQDKAILDTIRRHWNNEKVVVTNCSGISILYRAGILEGYRVTAAGTVAHRLKEEGADVATPRRMWIGSPDGRLWTTAGGCSVHPSTVALVSRYFGENWGREIGMMWDSRPCYDSKLFDVEGPELFTYPGDEHALRNMNVGDGVTMEDYLLPAPLEGNR